MTQSNEDLEATYGPAATYREHNRGDHISYTTAEGLPGAGVIVWCQAPIGDIGLRYIVIPDEPTGFVDFVVPGDVITSTQETQEPTLHDCPYCQGRHYHVEQCPLRKTTP